MPIDPQCKAFLDQLASLGGQPLHELTPAQAREMALPPELAGPEEPVQQVEDRKIPGPGGAIPVRIYTPAAPAPCPALIYFHGGGFVLGNLDMSDRPCRQLANRAGCVVISVDYRLAPEHPFPAAVDDAYAVAQHVAEHADAFGVDPAAIAVGGESAGATLAAVTAIRARDAGTPKVAFQLLIYPQVDMNDDSPSMREYGDGHFLTKPLIAYFAGHYLADQSQRRHPYASPLHAELSGLPPAFIATAECDPLRDQAEAYAARLQQAGVRVTSKRYAGMIHPFFSLAGIIDGGKTAITDAANALRGAMSATT